jgi:hypothetical protein
MRSDLQAHPNGPESQPRRASMLRPKSTVSGKQSIPGCYLQNIKPKRVGLFRGWESVMSEPTEDNLDALPDGELMALPEDDIPRGWLTEFFARKAALIQQRESNELALELSGDSSST